MQPAAEKAADSGLCPDQGWLLLSHNLDQTRIPNPFFEQVGTDPACSFSKSGNFQMVNMEERVFKRFMPEKESLENDMRVAGLLNLHQGGLGEVGEKNSLG